MLARRSFLLGIGSLLAAPAVVHAANIMPIKAFRFEIEPRFVLRTSLPCARWRQINMITADEYWRLEAFSPLDTPILHDVHWLRECA